MYIREIHIMTYSPIERPTSIVQVKSVLIGVSMAARTVRTGMKTQTEIMFQIPQISIGHHFTAVFEPDSLGRISRKFVRGRTLFAACQPIKTGFVFIKITVVE